MAMKTTKIVESRLELSEPIVDDTDESAIVTVNPMSLLPTCPYCHESVADAERDKVHFPIAKRDGGTENLIGHHLCNLAAEGNIPQVNAVRKAYAVYKATMRVNGAIGHQNRALRRLRETENPAWVAVEKAIKQQRKQALKELSLALKTAAKEDKDIAWLLTIKGIGPIVTGGLVSYLWPLSRFRQVSSLWHYTGLHVVDGHKPKFERGKKADWNRNAFCALLDINQSIKGKNPIRDLYVKFRAIEDEKHPELTKGHRLNRALRRTRKEFLKNLWVHNRHGDTETDHCRIENHGNNVGLVHGAPDQPVHGTQTPLVGGFPFNVQRS